MGCFDYIYLNFYKENLVSFSMKMNKTRNNITVKSGAGFTVGKFLCYVGYLSSTDCFSACLFLFKGTNKAAI